MTERTTEQAPSRSSQEETSAAGSATIDTVTAPDPDRGRSQGSPIRGRGERIFRGLTSGSGLLVVAAVAAIGLFLLVQAVRGSRQVVIPLWSAHVGLDEQTAGAIRALDEHWDGRGYPYGLAGTDIPVLGRVLCLAQTVEVFHASGGRAAALDVFDTEPCTD